VTAPLTSATVAEQLAKLSRELDDLVTKIGVAEQAAVNAREDFTLAHAKAFLVAEGPMDVRKYTAIERTHVERVAAELAEAEVRGLRRSIDTVKVRIDVGRSVGAAMRAEVSLSGSGHLT
jgi:ubiquinone biosynthesis protein COQ9